MTGGSDAYGSDDTTGSDAEGSDDASGSDAEGSDDAEATDAEGSDDTSGSDAEGSDDAESTDAEGSDDAESTDAEDEKDKTPDPKEALIIRATAAGLNELASEIDSKLAWQLAEGTGLRLKYESMIRKAESDKTLNESRYFNNDVKDAFRRLL